MGRINVTSSIFAGLCPNNMKSVDDAGKGDYDKGNKNSDCHDNGHNARAVMIMIIVMMIIVTITLQRM